MLLNIAILEDDPKQSKELYKLLTTWATCHGHVFHIYQYTNGPSLLRAITQQTFHACFLDIQLNTEDQNAETGMETAVRLRKENYSGDLIFLTAFREYVFEGYNVQAFNFLLKPIDQKILEQVLSALILKYSPECYILKNKQQIQSLPYSKILAICADKHDIILMTKTESFTDHAGIQEIAAHLPDIFVQCHRSCIVNLSHITKIDGNTIYLSNKTTQTISRRYVTNVKTKYIKYITTGGNL